MSRAERFQSSIVMRQSRERRVGPHCRIGSDLQAASDAGEYQRICRECEASRLALAELGRRHGPLD